MKVWQPGPEATGRPQESWRKDWLVRVERKWILDIEKIQVKIKGQEGVQPRGQDNYNEKSQQHKAARTLLPAALKAKKGQAREMENHSLSWLLKSEIFVIHQSLNLSSLQIPCWFYLHPREATFFESPLDFFLSRFLLVGLQLMHYPSE